MIYRHIHIYTLIYIYINAYVLSGTSISVTSVTSPTCYYARLDYYAVTASHLVSVIARMEFTLYSHFK